MYKVLLASLLTFALAQARPGIVNSYDQEHLGLEAYSGASDLGGFSGQNAGYSGLSSYDAAPQHQLGASDGGDYHKGVSIVGAGGGDAQTTTFDLTKHAGDGGHAGTFGGTFVGSAKYEGIGGHAHKIADGDHGSYVAFDHGQYTDVLGASQDDSHGLDAGGYKWGFVPEKQ